MAAPVHAAAAAAAPVSHCIRPLKSKEIAKGRRAVAEDWRKQYGSQIAQAEQDRLRDAHAAQGVMALSGGTSDPMLTEHEHQLTDKVPTDPDTRTNQSRLNRWWSPQEPQQNAERLLMSSALALAPGATGAGSPLFSQRSETKAAMPGHPGVGHVLASNFQCAGCKRSSKDGDATLGLVSCKSCQLRLCANCWAWTIFPVNDLTSVQCQQRYHDGARWIEADRNVSLSLVSEQHYDGQGVWDLPGRMKNHIQQLTGLEGSSASVDHQMSQVVAGVRLIDTLPHSAFMPAPRSHMDYWSFPSSYRT